MFKPLRTRPYLDTRFQLLDEHGAGAPYAGLVYELVDREGQVHHGFLDGAGAGKVGRHIAGPVTVLFRQAHDRSLAVYSRLMDRKHYPLRITELQVRAEQTRWLDTAGKRTPVRPVHIDNDADYFQVEVRHLVKHVSHLPPLVDCPYPPACSAPGITLASGRYTVLEVRPLRALCPLLSTDPQFCALNLYQLALMATLSDCPFGHSRGRRPARSVSEELSMGDWQLSPEQAKSWYPLYENVAYSSRLEIVPFDPVLYPANDPHSGSAQETPATVHFRDDMHFGREGPDVQSFVTHNHEVMVIAVRGTCSWTDFLRDVDAHQVPFVEGRGNVHCGFYAAARQACRFVEAYMDKFHAGQPVLICGHSLGGAVALILAQMLRLRRSCEVQLYTYGAPRAADATFVSAAQGLVHQRMVNHNDAIPSVPGSWMSTRLSAYGAGALMTFTSVPEGFGVFVAGLNHLLGEPYQHHGTLRHFMPVEFAQGQVSHVLWEPLSDTVTQHALSLAVLEQKSAVPEPDGPLEQLVEIGQQFMVDSYIPSCWAVLRRSQQAQQARCSLVTEREVLFVDQALEHQAQQLRVKYREEMARTDSRFEVQVQTMNLLMREMSNVHQTRKQLYKLRFKVPSQADVFGRFALHPEALAQSLVQWEAHSESRRIDQLAMAPVDELLEDSLSRGHMLA